MRNLLLSEYLPLLASAAALWCADEGASVGTVDHIVDPTWTSKLSGTAATLTLEVGWLHGAPSGAPYRYLFPRAVIGSSGLNERDAARALVVLEEAITVLRRAVSAELTLKGIRVWIDRAPCDYCGTKGKQHNSPDPCFSCAGTGYRTEAA